MPAPVGVGRRDPCLVQANAAGPGNVLAATRRQVDAYLVERVNEQGKYFSEAHDRQEGAYRRSTDIMGWALVIALVASIVQRLGTGQVAPIIRLGSAAGR